MFTCNKKLLRRQALKGSALYSVLPKIQSYYGILTIKNCLLNFSATFTEFFLLRYFSLFVMKACIAFLLEILN